MDRWRLLRQVAIPAMILAGGLLATGQDARATTNGAECRDSDNNTNAVYDLRRDTDYHDHYICPERIFWRLVL